MSYELLKKIEKKYGTSGDWIVEKGHVAETKLIKELYNALKAATWGREKAEDNLRNNARALSAHNEIVKEKDRRIQELQHRLDNMKGKLIAHIEEF